MRYFIVHTTPKQFVEKYKSSISGSNFSYNLKDASLFDIVYSILPSNIFGYEEPLTWDNIQIIYSRIRSQSIVSRILACCIEQWRLFKAIKKHSTVWFYNITILNCLLFSLLRVFRKKTVGLFVIVADFTPKNDLLSKFCLYLTNRADGMITLSDSPLFTIRNRFILPGIVPQGIQYSALQKPISRSFLLSGALNEWIASTSMVLDTFDILSNLKLNISGRGQDVKKVTCFVENRNNIRYFGVLSYDDFKKLLDGNSFILSTRNPNYPENQCNFPSKVLEALLHNRIIISTIHYPQLDGIKYFEVPSDQDGFRKAIEAISVMDDDELMTYANQGELVMNKYSPIVWENTIKILEASHG